MRAVIQRVTHASVTIDGIVHAEIGTGLLIFLGIEHADTTEEAKWLASKIVQLRIFDDATGVMNLSAIDVKAELMVISQFTLHASTKKGNRPSYIRAAKPDVAIPLYQQMIQELYSLLNISIKSGIFGADMKISLVNDGPVTILIDSQNRE